jgi:hypothetical protein
MGNSAFHCAQSNLRPAKSKQATSTSSRTLVILPGSAATSTTSGRVHPIEDLRDHLLLAV